jgi:hypothetical protein
MIAPMTYYGPRSSYEPTWSPYTKVTAERAVRMAIGQELGTQCKVAQGLPREILALLMRLNERERPRQSPSRPA